MNDILEPFITSVQREKIRASIETARTLPRQTFTSKAFFELERDKLFSKQWTALCFSEQVAHVGDLFVIEFAGIPLLLVRGEDKRCRVFHNIVPYDSCLAVIDSQYKQTEIVTPYHGWHYNFYGKLIANPYWNGSNEDHLTVFDNDAGDLIEVSCQMELGIIFIHLDDANTAKVSDFDKHTKPLRKMLKDYRIDEIQMGRDADNKPLINEENLATNWKTHYENWALNVLHEAFTHEIYAESSQIPRIDIQGKKTYIEYNDSNLMALSYREANFAETYDFDEKYTQAYSIGKTYPHLGKTADALPEWAFIGSFFPNLHFAVFAHFIHIIITIPISAGKTRTIRAQFYEPESAIESENLETRLEIMDEFIQAGLEDSRITEAVQKGRQSPVYEQQFYSPFWDKMHYNFSKQVLDVLEKNI